jgi:transposase-like protein
MCEFISWIKKEFNTNTIIKLLEKECGKGVKSINHIVNRECAKSIVHLLKTNADKQAFEKYAERIGG